MRALVLAVLLGAAPASAEPPDTSHHRQFLGSARIGLGLRAIVPYEETVFCGDVDESGNAPICTGRAPASLDLELGYGATRTIDTVLELRLGLEGDFASGAAADGPRVFHIAPGARFFFSETGTTKVFTTAQLVIDFTDYPGTGTDVGVRNLTGLWYELGRRFGIYGYVGATATAARWLRFELEGGIGVQGRYP